jgi:hypothetical protein
MLSILLNILLYIPRNIEYNITLRNDTHFWTNL